jgi:hypothetical protein
LGSSAYALDAARAASDETTAARTMDGTTFYDGDRIRRHHREARKNPQMAQGKPPIYSAGAFGN